MGLSGVNALRANGETREGVADAVDFISDLRQAGDLGALPVGRNVVVIGGGMTAIDAAVQSKLLGAESVTILYRRGRDAMPASRYEQDLAASKGVRIVFNAMPVEILGNGAVTGVRVEYTRSDGKSLTGTGETFEIAADQVLKAIGQTLEGAPEELELAGGKIAVTGAGRTSVAGVWAGGDCASGGEDLTVTAVAEGRDAAEDIHQSLSAMTLRCRFHDLEFHSDPDQIPQPVLAGLRAADRQGIQRRARLQGRLGRRRLEDAGRGRPAHRQRQRPALRRDLGRGPAASGAQQHRADHRPPARGEPARDRAGQARLARPRHDRLDHGALRGGSWKAILPRSRRPAPTGSSSISAARTA
jgi:hypothetical protein